MSYFGNEPAPKDYSNCVQMIQVKDSDQTIFEFAVKTLDPVALQMKLQAECDKVGSKYFINFVCHKFQTENEVCGNLGNFLSVTGGVELEEVPLVS